jgi:hypothetical protein
MSSPAARLVRAILRRARAATASSPAECFESLRDDVVYTPPFQLLAWAAAFIVVVTEIASRQTTECVI